MLTCIRTDAQCQVKRTGPALLSAGLWDAMSAGARQQESHNFLVVRAGKIVMAYSILFFSIASTLVPLALSNPVSHQLLRASIHTNLLQREGLMKSARSRVPNGLPRSASGCMRRLSPEACPNTACDHTGLRI